MPIENLSPGTQKISQISSYATDLERFIEVLDSEVFVDVGKLRKYSRFGIPDQIRPIVWKFLLGIEKADRSNELTLRNIRAQRYMGTDKTNSEFGKRIRGEVNRYFQKLGKSCPFDVHNDPNKFEAIICAYLNTNNYSEYTPAYVQMCAPFVYVISEEYDVLYCFEQLMAKMDEYNENYTENRQVAKFLSQFHSLLPDLYGNFEDEEINLSEFVSLWLKRLLAPYLPLESTIELWDIYFSMPDFVDLHPYVCLAILYSLRDSLEELEHSEIRSIVFRLPKIDVQRIVNHAINLRSKSEIVSNNFKNKS